MFLSIGLDDFEIFRYFASQKDADNKHEDIDDHINSFNIDLIVKDH